MILLSCKKQSTEPAVTSNLEEDWFKKPAALIYNASSPSYIEICGIIINLTPEGKFSVNQMKEIFGHSLNSEHREDETVYSYWNGSIYFTAKRNSGYISKIIFNLNAEIPNKPYESVFDLGDLRLDQNTTSVIMKALGFDVIDAEARICKFKLDKLNISLFFYQNNDHLKYLSIQL